VRVNVEEKLTAILVADLADYERLLARDRARAEAVQESPPTATISAMACARPGCRFARRRRSSPNTLT
jgi:hypothetical protein